MQSCRDVKQEKVKKKMVLRKIKPQREDSSGLHLSFPGRKFPAWIYTFLPFPFGQPYWMFFLVTLLWGKKKEERFPFSPCPSIQKWSNGGYLGNESALLGERWIIYISVAPSCPKGELHQTTALGEHPRAGGKRGQLQGFLRHP